MIIAFSGHRPEDCRSEEDVRRCIRDSLDPFNVRTVITGMAAGVDLWAADEARLLGIEIWAARPWATHIPRRGDEDIYAAIIAASSKVVVVDESQLFPGPWVYHKRNEWMVDHATHVLAYWNPSKKSGGTYSCIQYARKMGVPVRNVWSTAI